MMVNQDCLWQFFRYKQENHTELHLTITHILEKIQLPIMRQNTLSGYRQLVTSMSEFLSTEAGRVMFPSKIPFVECVNLYYP